MCVAHYDDIGGIPTFPTNEIDSAINLSQEQPSSREETNYLTFGSSRRTMEYSSYGNQPVIVRRPAGSAVAQNVGNLSSQILRIYRKPRDSCTIN